MRRPQLATQKFEFPRAFSALDEIFDVLGRAFARYGVKEPDSFWLKLAAEEIFTNMIRHNQATGDRVTMSVAVDERHVVLSFTDYGVAPFDPDSVPKVDTTLTAEERTPGGLGVFLVRSKMDTVDYSHEAGNMTVSVSKTRLDSA